MAAPFQDSVANFYTRYVENPSKQMNLGWTVVSIFFIMSFFIGLLLMGLSFLIVCTNSDYSTGVKSKKNLMILAYVGFGLVLIGLWTTINSFYSVVAKINSNIRTDPDCSLFVKDTAVTAAELLISEATLPQDITDIINSKRNEQLNITANGAGVYDNSSSLVDLSPQAALSATGTPVTKVKLNGVERTILKNPDGQLYYTNSSGAKVNVSNDEIARSSSGLSGLGGLGSYRSSLFN